MCRTNPVTSDHILQMKSSLEKRLASPSLSAQQRAMLQAQYDYVIENIHEREGSETGEGQPIGQEAARSEYIFGS